MITVDRTWLRQYETTLFFNGSGNPSASSTGSYVLPRTSNEPGSRLRHSRVIKKLPDFDSVEVIGHTDGQTFTRMSNSIC